MDVLVLVSKATFTLISMCIVAIQVTLLLIKWLLRRCCTDVPFSRCNCAMYHKLDFMFVLGLKRIVYFDIRIFFNFQTNSPNILYI